MSSHPKRHPSTKRSAHAQERALSSKTNRRGEEWTGPEATLRGGGSTSGSAPRHKAAKRPPATAEPPTKPKSTMATVGYTAQVHRLLQDAQTQQNLFTQSREAERVFRADQNVSILVGRVASAMGGLRIAQTTRYENYWHPQKHDAEKRRAKKALQYWINMFMNRPEQRQLSADKRYHTDPQHPSQPMHLVFDVFTDTVINDIQKEYHDVIPYRATSDTYKIPRYLCRCVHRTNFPVHTNHWQEVARLVEELATPENVNAYLERARVQSNKRVTQYKWKHPDDTRSYHQLVKDGVLTSIVQCMWQNILQDAFDRVNHGCRELTYSWQLRDSVPKKMTQSIIPATHVDQNVKHAACSYVKWTFFRKQCMKKFKEDNPQIPELRQMRNEGTQLLAYMMRYNVSRVYFQNVPFLLDQSEILPFVQLRLQQRKQTYIKRPDVRKRLLPQIAHNMTYHFRQSLGKYVDPQAQASVSSSASAAVDDPSFIPNTAQRGLSLCDIPHIRKHDMQTVVEHTSFITEAQQMLRSQGTREMSANAPRLMEQNQMKQQRYLIMEVYVPETMTGRTDGKLERVPFQFRPA